VAALGLASAGGNGLGPEYADGFFVGQHGSWNRKPRSGYNVVFIKTAPDGRPSGAPIEILTGFVSPGGDAWGRPVGVVVDRRGALLVADDVGNVVWRVTRDSAAPGVRASASAEHAH
jgi:glucose/arabinose dehydrogenase